MTVRPLLAAGLLLLASSARAADKPRAEVVREALKEPVKKLATFGFDPKVPLEERVGPAPPVLLEFLKKIDGKADYRAYAPTPEQQELLREWLSGLPLKMREAFRERLIGMFFVENFTGNGLTDFALDEKGKLYPLIVFNPVGFGRTLSQTLTLRDASAFKGDAGVAVDCGGDERGMLYTILHEGTHAYDFIRGVTPYVEDVEVYAVRGGKGLDVSWDVWKGYGTPKKESDYPNRTKVHFYGLGGGPALTAADAPETYRELAYSPFVSLYGSQSWAEDAADLFTFYHLSRAFKRRCEVRVGGDKPFSFEPLRPGSKARARAERLYGGLY